MHSVWSQLYEILEQAKLTYGDKNKISGGFVGEGDDWEAAWKDFL